MRHLKKMALLLFMMNSSASANVALDELAQLDKQKHNVSSVSVTQPISPINQSDAFTKDHTLVLFFSSTCAYCNAFAPIVKQWSSSAGYGLEAYTTNGSGLPDFPKPDVITPALKTMYFGMDKVIVPALFLVNINNHQAYPVSIGYLSETELSTRMQQLTVAVQQYEGRGNS